MSELGKVPSGLLRSAAVDLFWGVALSQLMVNPEDHREWVLLFPLLTGPVIIESTVPGEPGLSGS